MVTKTDIQQGATWGIDRTDQRLLPLDSTYSYSYTGAGVLAFILDTGEHADSIERISVNTADSLIVPPCWRYLQESGYLTATLVDVLAVDTTSTILAVSMAMATVP